MPQTLRRFEAVEQHAGRVCLVQLTCSKPALESRVTQPHRASMGKFAAVDALRESLAAQDNFTPIPGRESYSIDNTDVAAETVASMIIEHFGLFTMP